MLFIVIYWHIISGPYLGWKATSSTHSVSVIWKQAEQSRQPPETVTERDSSGGCRSIRS